MHKNSYENISEEDKQKLKQGKKFQIRDMARRTLCFTLSGI